MNKFLRFSLVALLCAMFNVTFADDIKFDFDNDYATLFPTLAGVSSQDSHDGDFTAATTSTAVQGATVTVSAKTSGNNDNRIWSASPRLRMYSGSLTITAPADMDITAIAFEAGKFNANNKTNVGTLTRDDDTKASWVGQANQVVMEIAGNTQLKTMTMTVVASGQEVPATITIDGTTPFYGSTQVTISINKEAYDMYYTLDGTDPATNDNAIKYTAPFTISESCTVKVFDEVSQASAEKAFEKAETPVVDNIAAFKALPNNTVAELTLTNAKVLYSFTTTNGNNSTYVRDNSGAILFYNSAKELAKDEDVNGTIIVTRSEYNSNIQAIANDQTNVDNLIHVAGAAAQPKTIALSQVADNANDLVTFANVTVTKEENNFYAVSGEDKVQVYNKFHIAAYEEGFDAFVGTDEYNITGILEAYNTSFEICPIEDGVVTGINEVTTASEENGAMYNVAGQRVDSAYKGIVIMNGKKMIQK